MREKGYIDGLAFYPMIDSSGSVQEKFHYFRAWLAGGQLLNHKQLLCYSGRVSLGYSGNNIRH